MKLFPKVSEPAFFAFQPLLGTRGNKVPCAHGTKFHWEAAPKPVFQKGFQISSIFRSHKSKDTSQRFSFEPWGLFFLRKGATAGEHIADLPTWLRISFIIRQLKK